MATSATAPKHDVDFLKTAIKSGELSKEDAQRCLKLLKKSEGHDAGSIGEKLGVLSTSARVRVAGKVRAKKRAKSDAKKLAKSDAKKLAKSDAKKLAKSDAKPKSDAKVAATKPASDERKRIPSDGKRKRIGSDGKRRGTRRRPARKKSNAALPLLGVGFFALVVMGGAAAFVFNKDSMNPSNDAALGGWDEYGKKKTGKSAPAAATPAATETKANQTETATKTPEISEQVAAELDFALGAALKLRDAEKEISALEVIDEFLVEHPKLQKALDAREELLDHCRVIIKGKARRARMLARQQNFSQAAHMVASLRSRLPKELHGEVNVLALELRKAQKDDADAAGEAPSEPKPESPRIAKKEVKKVAPGPAVAPPAEKEEEQVAAAPKKAKPVAPKPVVRKATPKKKAAPRPVVEEDDSSDDDSLDMEGEDGEDSSSELDADSPVALAVKDMVSVPHKLRKNGEFEATYPLTSMGELEDFESRGMDKYEIRTMEGVSVVTRTGLEIGVGSQRVGKMLHSLTLQSNFQIDLECWFNASSGRSVLVFLIGDKLGVSFGQQIVKVSRSGSLKPLSRVCEKSVFGGERLVKVQITCKDDVLTVKCNGRKTAEKKMKKGVSGQFGVLAKDLRMQITSLKIKGMIDTAKL